MVNFIFNKRSNHKYYFLVTIICSFLLLLFLSPTNVYANNDNNRITLDELKRIKSELDISDEYPFNMFNDSDLLKVLNQEIDNSTYGQAILTALDEQHLISHCYPTFHPQKATTYFNNIIDRFSSKSVLSAEKLSKLAIKGAVQYLQLQKINLGVSTLLLLSDIAEISISLKEIERLFEKPILHNYFLQRYVEYPHSIAWQDCGIASFLQNNVTENYFSNLWDHYGFAIQKRNLQTFFEVEQQSLVKLIENALEELKSDQSQGYDLVLSSPLIINPDPPYYLGDEVKAKFSLLNREKKPITLCTLTVGGRDSDECVVDFSHRQNIIIEPSKSFDYEGTLRLNKTGNYHFFCTYQTPNGEWNTSIEVDERLPDKKRIADIEVKDKKQKIAFKTFYYKDDCMEYSVKYPDWPDIADDFMSFNHINNVKKTLNVGNSADLSVHIIISQDKNYMQCKELRGYKDEKSYSVNNHYNNGIVPNRLCRCLYSCRDRREGKPAY